jgi:hypothetical protein
MKPRKCQTAPLIASHGVAAAIAADAGHSHSPHKAQKLPNDIHNMQNVFSGLCSAFSSLCGACDYGQRHGRRLRWRCSLRSMPRFNLF